MTVNEKLSALVAAANLAFAPMAFAQEEAEAVEAQATEAPAEETQQAEAPAAEKPAEPAAEASSDSDGSSKKFVDDFAFQLTGGATVGGEDVTLPHEGLGLATYFDFGRFSFGAGAAFQRVQGATWELGVKHVAIDYTDTVGDLTYRGAIGVLDRVNSVGSNFLGAPYLTQDFAAVAGTSMSPLGFYQKGLRVASVFGVSGGVEYQVADGISAGAAGLVGKRAELNPETKALSGQDDITAVAQGSVTAGMITANVAYGTASGKTAFTAEAAASTEVSNVNARLGVFRHQAEETATGIILSARTTSGQTLINGLDLAASLGATSRNSEDTYSVGAGATFELMKNVHLGANVYTNISNERSTVFGVVGGLSVGQKPSL